MAEIPAEAVQAAAEAMDRAVKHLSLDGGTSRTPGFSLAELAQVGLRAAAPFMAGERSDGDGVQAAPESTDTGEGAIPRVVGPSAHPIAPETLSALRERIDAVMHRWLCPDCHLPKAVDAVVDVIREHAEAAAEELAASERRGDYVAETGERWRRLWEQVGRERSDALVRAEQAEAALTRVDAPHHPLTIGDYHGHPCLRCPTCGEFPCAHHLALHDETEETCTHGAGAVSEEQTGGPGQ